MSRKRKKKKKISFQRKTIIFLVVVAVILVAGLGVFTHITYNEQYSNDVESISSAEAHITSIIPSEVDSNLDFLDLSDSFENLVITYSSSNENVIDSEGRVYRPSYISDNQMVTLTITIKVVPDSPLANIYYNVLGGTSKSFDLVVTVIKQAATTSDKLDVLEDQLYVPSITASNIGLPSEINIFDNASISWSTSDSDVITNDGKIVDIGHSILNATIEVDNEIRELSFPIEVVSTIDKTIFEDFENLNLTNTYNIEKETNDLILTQSVLNEVDNNSFLRMRSSRDSGVDVNSEIIFKNSFSGLKMLSFDYYSITESAFNNDVYIYIMISEDDGENYSIYESIKIEDTLNHSAEINLESINKKVKLKISFHADYSTNFFLALDNLKLVRDIEKGDVEREILDAGIVPTSLTDSYLLPLSTPYGGVIEWVSNNEEVLSPEGKVTRQDETISVQMVAYVSGVVGDFTITYDITIFGTSYMVPVEVFFIDLGKYGTADNGESIYFKIGEIDILVDAGDNMNATKQSISEIIDNNSEDGIIDYIIATHPDADHIGSMNYIIDTYEVLNIVYFEGDHKTNIYSRFKESVDNTDWVSECTILESVNNLNDCTKVIELAPGITIEFIDTGYYDTKEPNGRSIVFVLEAYGTKLLMTGDADNAGGRRIEQNYMHEVGDIDILKVVHHGTREGTTLEFLDVVRPEYAIITNGNYFGNRHGHPTFETINRLYQHNNMMQVYAVVGGDSKECTLGTSYQCNHEDVFVDRNGTITLTINVDGFEFASEYNDEMIELSSTYFWQNHTMKEYEYGK